jgi:hypothetical protein
MVVEFATDMVHTVGALIDVDPNSGSFIVLESEQGFGQFQVPSSPLVLLLGEAVDKLGLELGQHLWITSTDSAPCAEQPVQHEN